MNGPALITQKYFTMKDLFEHPDELPEEVQKILSKYDDWDQTYEQCRDLEAALKPLGYTFDWYLDAQPYNLRKINQ